MDKSLWILWTPVIWPAFNMSLFYTTYNIVLNNSLELITFLFAV